MDVRKLVSEALGTALLVFFGVGVATLTFGFKLTGPSVSAGVVATALASRRAEALEGPAPSSRRHHAATSKGSSSGTGRD